VKSAAFVKHVRRRFKKTTADKLLRYLQDKYTEYKWIEHQHSDAPGFSGYSVPRKLWDESKQCTCTAPLTASSACMHRTPLLIAMWSLLCQAM
jgi:hypothetical protein